jgi:hypothetical protein
LKTGKHQNSINPCADKNWHQKRTNRRRGIFLFSFTSESRRYRNLTPQPQHFCAGFQGLGGGALNKLFAKCINFALLAAMQM